MRTLRRIGWLLLLVAAAPLRRQRDRQCKFLTDGGNARPAR